MAIGRVKARAMVGIRLLRFVSRLAAMPLCLCLGCQGVAVDDQRTLFVSVRDPIARMPLEGVELCEYDTANCTKTDDEGLATLELPAGEDVAYSLVKVDYGSILAADRTDDTFGTQRSFSMWTDAWLAERSSELGTEWPLGAEGGIWIFTEMGGVTFELLGTNKRPFYSWFDEETGWHSSFDLPATTDSGVGGFVPTAPRDYRVRLGGTARRCVPVLAWAAEEPNEVRVPVVADHTTYVFVNCVLL